MQDYSTFCDLRTIIEANKNDLILREKTAANIPD